MSRYISVALSLIPSLLLYGDSVPYVDYCPYDIHHGFEYSDIADRIIRWEGIFDIDENNYFIYLYSPYCGHCQEIKKQVLLYAFCGEVDMYFIEISEEVTFGSDIELTIGATSTEQLWILGYPSLLEIKNANLIANIAGAKGIKEKLRLGE